MWYQLEVCCKSDTTEPLTSLLEELGAVSIALSDRNDDAILEPPIGTTPLWPEVTIQALYTEEMQALITKAAMELHFPELHFNLQQIADKNWLEVCKQDFKPQNFGKKLWICPSWEQPPDPHAVNIILDPGVAFGTGTHPTTSLCLRWLDGAPLNNKTLIDFGCGSGILALAAVKLGARKVYAVDIDPQALMATEMNAKTNAISDEVLEITLPTQLNKQADYVIANILLTPLLELEKKFKDLLKPGAYLIVSGILSSQVEQLIQEYSLFTHKETYLKEEWALLVFLRKDDSHC